MENKKKIYNGAYRDNFQSISKSYMSAIYGKKIDEVEHKKLVAILEKEITARVGKFFLQDVLNKDTLQSDAYIANAKLNYYDGFMMSRSKRILIEILQNYPEFGWIKIEDIIFANFSAVLKYLINKILIEHKNMPIVV
jgi:hypothetical protein